MPTKVLKVKAKGSFQDWRKRAGTFVEKEEIQHIIDYDCDAYDEKGNPLFFFRKNAISAELCRTAHLALRKAATGTNNRGDAAGFHNALENTSIKGDRVNVGKVQKRFTVVKKDGTLDRVARANHVNSGIIGYFDRNVRFPFCRLTAWTEQNLRKFEKARPYIQAISDEFKKASPDKWQAQNEIALKTNKDFIIKDTVFTTVTVNKNFRTAIHTDAGDYEKGLGNIAVLQVGDYNGGETCLPRYGVGFNVRNTDVCFFNVHEWHGNLPITAKKPYERISLVCYYRKNMSKCGSKDEELEIVKRRKNFKGLNK
jgi:hypothetical protein